MKVAIVIITYNLSSEMFLLQIAAVRKFCTDENYTIEVFDNSSDLERAEHIKYHAEQQQLNYYKTFSSSINGSDSHAWAANLAYQKIKKAYSHYFFLDHDCIPLREFSVVEILNGGHVIAGLGQGALKTYFWPGMVMFAATSIDRDMVDFSCSSEFALDTGGNLYKIVEEYGKEACIFFNEAYHQNPYFVSHEYSSYATINDDMFMHFINSSNWAGKDRHEERINSLLNIAKAKTGL